MGTRVGTRVRVRTVLLPRPATFQLRQNFGIVLCVDKKNLLEINSELKANTITEDGWEVVMEKKVSPDQKRRTNSLEAQDSADSATIARR